MTNYRLTNIYMRNLFLPVVAQEYKVLTIILLELQVQHRKVIQVEKAQLLVVSVKVLNILLKYFDDVFYTFLFAVSNCFISMSCIIITCCLIIIFY